MGWDLVRSMESKVDGSTTGEFFEFIVEQGSTEFIVEQGSTGFIVEQGSTANTEFIEQGNT